MLNCQNAAAIRFSLCVGICSWSTIRPLAVFVEMWFLNHPSELKEKSCRTSSCMYCQVVLSHSNLLNS